MNIAVEDKLQLSEKSNRIITYEFDLNWQNVAEKRNLKMCSVISCRLGIFCSF